MQQIADWLEKLGMSEYSELFAENKINISALRYLTDQDLKDIGIPLGHRRIMLAAITSLNDTPTVASPGAQVAPSPAPLLDIPLPQERASTLVPEELRRRQLAALTNWVIASARTQPLVLALEDLHWADPTIREAMTAMETTKERWCEAEVNRIAGEIALKSPELDKPKAEAYFERAVSVARQQQAKSWELRTAMSMARLWRDQGKQNQARDLLAPVYGWFTEGFDTRDLKEAKVLLDELAA
jgi:hypothetical protein